MNIVKDINYSKRNWRRDVGINVATFLIAAICVSAWYPDIMYTSFSVVILSPVAAFVLHELAHGFLFKLWTGKVKFGAGSTKFGPVLYATSPGRDLSRNQMIVLALIPQLLTLIYFIGAGLLPPSTLRSILAIGGTINLGGGTGDFYVIAQMLKYPKELRVGDRPSGLTFYMPSTAEE